MARVLKRLAIAVLALGVLVLAAGAWSLRRLDAPEVRKALVTRASAALGAPVRVEEMEIGLLSGVRLQGVGVANPAPFSGDLLTADTVMLRYRLLPLLSGRVLVDRLALRRPVLALAADSRGGFNYERLGTRSAGPAAGGTALPLRVVLSRFDIDEGTLTVADASGTRLLRLEQLELRASVEAGPEGMASDTRLSGALAGSGVQGTLVAQADVARASGARATPTGQGRAEIRGCRVEGSAIFSLLAAALRLPELARPEMDECRVEFRMGGGRVVMPVVALKGKAAQLTGTGSVLAANGALDFEMNLALREALLDRLPAKELRAAFKSRGDGYGVLPFALRGTTARPETDVASRLARAAAGEAAKGKLKSILDKVF